uniref:Uncharacterized protein n=1 Tax=Nelumbo nucifera TaxID=4432 RepID=A0A822Z6D1_NELNU|nr:TPA_asm: hypothetical protein HUJ06_013348 [Nelumbo nucifera]
MRREIGRVTIRNLLSRTSELKTVGESLTEEERAACFDRIHIGTWTRRV